MVGSFPYKIDFHDFGESDFHAASPKVTFLEIRLSFERSCSYEVLTELAFAPLFAPVKDAPV